MTDTRVVYIAKNNSWKSVEDNNKCLITDWQGKILGVGKKVSSWSTPESYLSSYQYAIRAEFNDEPGVIWYGRTGGTGLSCVLRKSKTLRSL